MLPLILTITFNKTADLTSKSNSSIGDAGVDTKAQNLLKIKFNKKLAKSKKPDFANVDFSKTNFFTFKARATFIYLQKIFTKAPILYYFDPKCHIQIERDAWGISLMEF